MILEDLLTALQGGPRTVSQLGHRLNASPGQLEAALLQLKRGGYVDRAIPGQGDCHSGCGGCSMRALCPSNSLAGQTAQETWRLTGKAFKKLAGEP